MNNYPKTNDTWSLALRQNFLNGVQAILKFIANIEGMNTILRQDVEHIQTENEWETAYSIFFQIRSTISLSILWAISNVSFFSA